HSRRTSPAFSRYRASCILPTSPVSSLCSNRIGLLGAAAVAFSLLLTATGCHAQRSQAENIQPGGMQPGAVSGAAVYVEHCAVCHGTEGRGDGEAAARFAVVPRDLTVAQYRFRTTGSGRLPTDADLRRSIASGLGG